MLSKFIVYRTSRGFVLSCKYLTFAVVTEYVFLGGGGGLPAVFPTFLKDLIFYSKCN